jgi:metal-responsive CopG/Arc/MetJ family transcriptional regulator
MKTAVSVPDSVFSEAERLAKRLKKSRSQLYSEALAYYIARHDLDAVTEKMNEVLAAIDEPFDPGVAAAVRDTLERVEW